MIHAKHRKEAKVIGDDSWELLSFRELPQNASAARQVEALTKDRNWQTNHYEEICRRIDVLMEDIEERKTSLRES